MDFQVRFKELTSSPNIEMEDYCSSLCRKRSIEIAAERFNQSPLRASRERAGTSVFIHVMVIHWIKKDKPFVRLFFRGVLESMCLSGTRKRG